MTRSGTTGVEPASGEETEIVGLGGHWYDYWEARGAGYSHGECVEAARLGWSLAEYRRARAVRCTHAECVEAARMDGGLSWYRWARGAGATHAECVEVVGLGGGLYWYREARRAGVSHATVVDAVTVHGLPAGLLRVFAKRMSRRSCSKQWPVLGDPRVGGCGFRGSGRRIVRCGCRDGVRTSPVRQGCLWDRKQVGTRQAVGW